MLIPYQGKTPSMVSLDRSDGYFKAGKYMLDFGLNIQHRPRQRPLALARIIGEF